MFLKSRRSFLKGRVPQRTTWQQFCEHVTKQMPNRLQLLSGVDTYLTTDAKLKKTQARFVPKNAQDVYAVFYLAEQFGITLGLYDEQWAQFYKVPALVWLDPSELNRCQFLTHGTRVYIEPGCTMHQLVSLGLDQFAALPGSMRFIDWLSEPGYFQQRSLNDSGVQMVSMVQADRSIARLGPFGTHSKMGLNTPTLQQLVPKLFQLLETEIAQECLRLPFWPGCFRLDTMADPNAVNLAYLALGQKMQLGWVEWVVLDAQKCVQPDLKQVRTLTQKQTIWAQELDAAIRQLFDPQARFLDLL